MKICIVTCNIGNYEKIFKLNIDNKDKFDWYYFSDKKIKNGWTNILLKDIDFSINDINEFNSLSRDQNKYTINRMKTKFIKLQTHQILKDYDYYIWIDAGFPISNKNFVNDIIDLINNKDLILFNHYHKDDKHIRGEIKRCLSWKKKSCKNQKFKEQIEFYLGHEGFKDNKLYCGGFFIRSNKINNFFDEWYRHNQIYSYRDQTSLPFLIWKYKIDILALDGHIDNNKLLGKKRHKKRND